MRDFIEIFHRIEREHDARELMCGGIRIWPLVKFLLAREIFDYVKEKKLLHLTHGIDFMSKLKFGSQIAADTCAQIAAPPRQSDICLFTYESFRHYKVGGRWSNIFQDPLLEFARASGQTMSTLELQNIFPGRRPKLNPTKSVTLDVVRAQLAARLALSRSPDLIKDVAKLREWTERLRGIVGSGECDALKASIDTAVPSLFSMARIFERHLQKIRPSLGLLANYYSVSGLAFCLACWRCGIPSADISHGASGEYHYAYGGWGPAPAGGYELLPTEFLSRTKEDAAALASLMMGHDGVRQPTVVGDLAAHAWRANSYGVADGPRAMLETVRPRGTDGRMEVLIAAQNVEGLPQAMTEAIRASSDRCFFWIRFHPIYLADLKNFVIDLPGGCFNLIEATKPPPYALLERVGAVMTESSSLADDARAWGIKSIIVHEFGSRLYASQIAAGQMVFAGSGAAADEALRHVVAQNRGSMNSCDTSELDRQRDDLLRFLQSARGRQIGEGFATRGRV